MEVGKPMDDDFDNWSDDDEARMEDTCTVESIR